MKVESALKNSQKLAVAIVKRIREEQGSAFVEKHQKEMYTQLAIVQEAMTSEFSGQFETKESYFKTNPENTFNFSHFKETTEKGFMENTTYSK